MDTFRAFRIFETGGQSAGELVDLSLDDLSEGEVVIEAAYSSVNYKDALAGTGTGKILRRFPLVGGIDVAGTVASSRAPGVAAGTGVVVTGHDMSVTHDGGYAGYVRVPAGWAVPLPDGMTPRDAMVIGTAGFTAALSVVEMERNGLTPNAGPVIVTGATGGVGSLAVAMLAGLGCEVTALTGKDDAHDYLLALGAREVLSRHALEMGTRPLEKARWAGAVDPAGGAILAWLTRTMRYSGCIASCGLTAGMELNTTVLPFILRGVKLLGIDSVACPDERRREVWRRLAADMKPALPKEAVTEITLDGLPEAFATLLEGRARGRIVVRI